MRDKDQIRFQGEWKKLQKTVDTLEADMKEIKKALAQLQRELDELRRNAAGEAK
jgi:uncharacterized protein YukE